MSFHDRLYEARKRSGLTQAQLAELIGVAKTTYTGYEIGRSEPDMNRTVLLMHHLGVDANYLWQDEMNAAGVLHSDITDHELRLITKYRALDYYGRQAVNAIMEIEYERFINPLSRLDAKQKEIIDRWLAEDEATTSGEA